MVEKMLICLWLNNHYHYIEEIFHANKKMYVSMYHGTRQNVPLYILNVPWYFRMYRGTFHYKFSYGWCLWILKRTFEGINPQYYYMQSDY